MKLQTKLNYFVGATITSILLAPQLSAVVPRDSNFGNTAAYNSSGIDARLNVSIDDKTDTIHFIRDNNDPRVITKTYIINHVDPYEFRDYLRQMVQSKRVGNATLQESYPSNTTTSPYEATTSSPELTSANAQSSYSPTVQLGSNTAVECLRYADGSGLLIVSAEDYRFKDSTNGIGIDSLVEYLDSPKMGSLSSGSQMFIYMPKFVPARNLQPLLENMGMNVSDVTELWQGGDLVAYDPDLNWLVFDVANFSCDNIANMLTKYDVPVPQVRLKVKVYEVTSENDEKIGIDFQSWKNNEGADLFSAGGRYRNNWQAMYSGKIMPNKGYGSENSSFFNFNPKWNSRYIDFLTSKGKAKVVHSGELVIRNNYSASLACTTQLVYIDSSTPVSGTTIPTDSDNLYEVGAYKLLSTILDYTFTDDIAVGKGNQQVTTVSATDFGFTMDVDNVSVNLNETLFKITLTNTSLLGFQSDGTPRISTGNKVSQTVSLPHNKDGFVIGGLAKDELVKSKTGIPLLMDIPWLGYIFSSESTSIKHSELIVVASCEWESPEVKEHLKEAKLSNKSIKSVPKGNL